MQRKNTMEAVNSASSVVRTSGTDESNVGSCVKTSIRNMANVDKVTLVKNENYQVLIEDMGNDGEGIGHVQGMTVFVKDAVVGDLAEVKIVKVKKNIAYGRLMKLITPSHTVWSRCATKRRGAADAPCSRFPMSSSSNTSGTR